MDGMRRRLPLADGAARAAQPGGGACRHARRVQGGDGVCRHGGGGSGGGRRQRLGAWTRFGGGRGRQWRPIDTDSVIGYLGSGSGCALPRQGRKLIRSLRSYCLSNDISLYEQKPLVQCVLVIRESFTREYGSRVFHSRPCRPLFTHFELNQLSLITRTHCTAAQLIQSFTSQMATESCDARGPITWSY